LILDNRRGDAREDDSARRKNIYKFKMLSDLEVATGFDLQMDRLDPIAALPLDLGPISVT
jgi:hypothetical protein